MVVVKACNSFREAYGPISERICLTDTPSAASANLISLPFRKVPGTFYPFSTLDEYQIKIS
jgi:microcystin degradation protein MlrC